MGARLNRVNKARKSPGKCGKCGKTIEAGEGYFHWKFRFGGKRIRCTAHPPEAWERESNSKRADLMQAGDAMADARNAETVGEAASALRDAIGYTEAARDEFQNAVDAWSGTGLENSEMSENFQAAVDELDTWIDDAEQAASELEDWDPDDPDNQGDNADDWADVIVANLDDVPDPEF